jgi:iron complex transport system substrate-binding protein
VSIYGRLTSTWGLLLLALAGGAAGVSAAAAAYGPVVDDDGQTVALAAPPRRVISLSPGATAMLYAAGGGARIVGTAEYSVEPEAARAILRIGDAHGYDIERILALKPDVVVAWSGGSSVAQLAPLVRAGIPVYHHSVTRLDDLPAALERLGRLLDTRATADSAAAALRARITALRQRYARAAAPGVLLQVWDRPVYTVGGAQLMSDVVGACGFSNVFGELRDAAPPVTLEAVAARDPQVIIALAADDATAREWLDHWKAYPTLRAVAGARLLAVVDARLSRLGPATLDAAESLCARLAPLRP